MRNLLLLAAAASALSSSSAIAQHFPHIDLGRPCREYIARASQELAAYRDARNASAASGRADYKVRLAAFENIKALTLVDETKASGKLAVLPPFPEAIEVPPVPTYNFRRLGSMRMDCTRATADHYRPIPGLIGDATTARDAASTLNDDMARLKATYENFKRATQDY